MTLLALSIMREANNIALLGYEKSGFYMKIFKIIKYNRE
jgi:hypothetical protein